MKRRFNRTQRNYIIAGLCMILVIMGVGYAAFSSQLRISGTSNITSNWSVKITDIQSKVVNGTPANASAPTHTDTTATFRTTLTSPGDTMQYDVTVSNEGDIDAKLDKITVPESTNPAIGFEVSGIEEGSLLEAKQTAKLTVTVKYNDVTEQPSDLTADLEVTLDYSQAPEGYVPPEHSITPNDLKSLAVTEGDGLYADEYENGKYDYRGTNPDNYIMFGDDIWRIMSVGADGTLKIVALNNFVQPWDDMGIVDSSNNWIRPSTLNTYLNNDILEVLVTNNADKVINYDFGIGKLTENDVDLADQIKKENDELWNGKIALQTVSEFIRASSNTKKCGNFDLFNSNFDICYDSNWMIYMDGGLYGRNIWTLTPCSSSSDCVWSINDDGFFDDYAYLAQSIFPTLNLSSDITLLGAGTKLSPFQITN